MIVRLQVALAALIVTAWAVLDMLGARGATRVVAGAAGSGHEALMGASYVALHLATLVVAPILVLSALMMAAWRRWRRPL